MNRLYKLATGILAVAALSAAPAAQAQQARTPIVARTLEITAAQGAGTGVAPLLPFDTLFTPRLAACPLTYYVAGQGRFNAVFGNNIFGDREKVIKHEIPAGAQRVTLSGVLIAFVDARIANPDSFISAVYYDIAPTGGPANFTRRMSDPLTMDDVDTSNRRLVFTEFSFSTRPVVPDSFFVGIALPRTAGDSVAMWSTNLTCPGVTERRRRNWELDGDNVWLSMNTSWSAAGTFFSDMLALPIVELNTPLATLPALSALVFVSPVPARRELVVTLPNNMRGMQTYRLINSAGQVLATGKQNGVALTIPRGSLSAGVYMLHLTTPQGPVVKRVVFQD